MPEIEIILVKRPHRWLVKRGSDVMTCSQCGMTKAQTASLICFEEEVEREIPATPPTEEPTE